MDLRTRYTALVTLTTQHVKYISDALRRLEEEEVFLFNISTSSSTCAYILAFLLLKVFVHTFLLFAELPLSPLSLCYTVSVCVCAERGGGGDAGQGGPGLRSSGLGERSPGAEPGPQR